MPIGAIMDDQPISAGFFGESKWLSEYITPNNLDVQTLYQKLTNGISDQDERLAALFHWVANNVRYKPFISGTLCIEGKCSRNPDLWSDPTITLRTKWGNCVNRAFLLESLVRNELPPDQAYCVLGNLCNGKDDWGGHAWVQVQLDGIDYIMESTRKDIPPFIIAAQADRYEPVHYFNDQQQYYIPGRTVMTPFTREYSTFLRDYLDWTYIKSGGRGVA